MASHQVEEVVYQCVKRLMVWFIDKGVLCCMTSDGSYAIHEIKEGKERKNLLLLLQRMSRALLRVPLYDTYCLSVVLPMDMFEETKGHSNFEDRNTVYDHPIYTYDSLKMEAYPNEPIEERTWRQVCGYLIHKTKENDDKEVSFTRTMIDTSGVLYTFNVYAYHQDVIAVTIEGKGAEILELATPTYKKGVITSEHVINRLRSTYMDKYVDRLHASTKTVSPDELLFDWYDAEEAERVVNWTSVSMAIHDQLPINIEEYDGSIRYSTHQYNDKKLDYSVPLGKWFDRFHAETRARHKPDTGKILRVYTYGPLSHPKYLKVTTDHGDQHPVSLLFFIDDAKGMRPKDIQAAASCSFGRQAGTNWFFIYVGVNGFYPSDVYMEIAIQLAKTRWMYRLPITVITDDMDHELQTRLISELRSLTGTSVYIDTDVSLSYAPVHLHLIDREDDRKAKYTMTKRRYEENVSLIVFYNTAEPIEDVHKQELEIEESLPRIDVRLGGHLGGHVHTLFIPLNPPKLNPDAWISFVAAVTQRIR
jgi:hypothetical protein